MICTRFSYCYFPSAVPGEHTSKIHITMIKISGLLLTTTYNYSNTQCFLKWYKRKIMSYNWCWHNWPSKMCFFKSLVKWLKSTDDFRLFGSWFHCLMERKEKAACAKADDLFGITQFLFGPSGSSRLFRAELTL